MKGTNMWTQREITTTVASQSIYNRLITFRIDLDMSCQCFDVIAPLEDND